MPTGTVSIEIAASAAAVFDLIHDYSRRLEWDPFLREAVLLNGATEAGAGVSSRCTARAAVGGIAMETVHVSFHRPGVAAVRMTNGPWFLKTFAAAIRHDANENASCRVTYRYNFSCRPRWLLYLIQPIVNRVFHRETIRRLRALKQFMECRSSSCSPPQ
jgi:hypothetical protein